MVSVLKGGLGLREIVLGGSWVQGLGSGSVLRQVLGVGIEGYGRVQGLRAWVVGLGAWGFFRG